MSKPSNQHYLKAIAAKLRRNEAEKARGDLGKLEELDQTQDLALLRKWAWVITIYGVLFSFVGVPLIIMVVQPFLSEWLSTLIWSFAKASMAISMLMFGTAIYFTTKLQRLD